MINICVLVRSLITGTGGAEKQAILLTKALSSEYRIFLVVLNGNAVGKGYLRQIKAQKTEHYLLKGNLISRIVEFSKILKRKDTEMIFSYLTSSNVWGAVIGRLLGVKYIIGGIRSSRLSTQKLVIERFLHNHLNHCTIVNNFAGAEMLDRKGFQQGKMFVIQNGIELINNFFVRESKDVIRILSVGRFVPSKDYHTAIKAIRYLLDHFIADDKSVIFTIIGVGPLQSQIFQWIDQYDLKQIIQIVINPDDLHNFYQNADIYLSTSVYEGLSNTILEALSYSLPVVATEVGDNRLIILDGINGFLIKKFDYQIIAEKLAFLVHSYDNRISFGRNGYNHCLKNFSMEKFKGKYVDFIDSTLINKLKI